MAPYNVRVNSISPGGIFNHQDSEFVKKYSQKVPMNRMGKEKELLSTLEYLISEESTYVTGQNVVVDGGNYMVKILKVVIMSKKLWRVGDLELKYVKRAIETGLTGQLTKEFELKFANMFDAEYAIAVNSGTSVLHASMFALGIGLGDDIVPPLTFIATAYAPLYVGAVPIFADIDPETFIIDPNEIEAKITSY